MKLALKLSRDTNEIETVKSSHSIDLNCKTPLILLLIVNETFQRWNVDSKANVKWNQTSKEIRRDFKVLLSVIS